MKFGRRETIANIFLNSNDKCKLFIYFRNSYTMWKKRPKLPTPSLLPSHWLPLHPSLSWPTTLSVGAVITGIQGISPGTEFNHFPDWNRLYQFMHDNHSCMYRSFSSCNTVNITEVATLSVETRPWHKACNRVTLKTTKLWFCSYPLASLTGTYKTTGFLP